MLFNVLIYVLVLYMFFSFMTVKKRTKKNQKLISVISSVRHPEEFYVDIEDLINETAGKDPEMEHKARIVKLWGMTYNKNYFKFEETLNEINLNALVRNIKGHSDIQANEDSFFYFMLAVPNMLAADGQKELRELVDAKLKEAESILDKQLITALYENFNKFYDETDDKGVAFYEDVLAGEYAGYYYSKSLIGLYKDLVTCMLAQVYVDNGETEKYEEVKADVERFMKSGVGERWIRNLNLPVKLPVYDEDGYLVEEEEKEETADTAEVPDTPLIAEEAESKEESEDKESEE